jgi:peptidoglycan hydrolase CwlO-like protein
MNIEYSLKEILTGIQQSIDKLDGKVDRLTEDVAEIKADLASTKVELKGEISTTKVELKGEISTTRAELKGEIKALDAKVDGLTKRVDTQEFINRGVIIGLLAAILGGLAKFFGWTGAN